MIAQNSTAQLATELGQLAARLLDRSQVKHADAIRSGHDSRPGLMLESQSHAYANAAVWLQEVLDRHAEDLEADPVDLADEASGRFEY